MESLTRDENSITILEALIAERTGLKLRVRQRELLNLHLVTRLHALQLLQVQSYVRLLEEESAAARKEWEKLITPLLNQESYFFRDKGQMALLQDKILPELIARNRATRTLRVWSAGCSTGEEAYSLAIIVEELLSKEGHSARRQWDIKVIGTDIDEQAIQFARRGVYRDWSFRMVSGAIVDRWFNKEPQGWRINLAPQSMVEFAQVNLVDDKFPSEETGLCQVDLILCRNVFIYFEQGAVSMVLKKFAQTLRTGGYLMTGHVESQERVPPPLEVRTFSESEVYQRSEVSEPSTPHLPETWAPKLAVTISVDDDTGDKKAEETLRLPVQEVKAESATLTSQELGQYLLDAQGLANVGRYDEAISVCMTILKVNQFVSEPYEILASIALEKGRDEEAKSLLKKAIYLAPSSPYLYMELGNFYQKQHDEGRARKMFITALELVEKMPPTSIIGRNQAADPGSTAAEYIAHLTELLQEGA